MNVIETVYFAKQFKRQVPKKIAKIAWSHLLDFLEHYTYEINDNIGRNFLKIRYEEAKMMKGKKLRIICYAVIAKNNLLPITIYAKQDRPTILEKEIDDHFECVACELSPDDFHSLFL